MVSQFTTRKGAGQKSGIHTFGGDTTPESDKVKQLKEALSAAISDKDAKIEELEKKHKAEVAELTERLQDVTAIKIDPAEAERVATLETDLADAQSKIKDFEKEVKILKTQKTKADNKLTEAAKLLRDSATKQKELQTEIDSLKA